MQKGKMFVLNLKRAKRNDPTEVILADPDFSESLLEMISKIKSGEVKWRRYDELYAIGFGRKNYKGRKLNLKKEVNIK